MLLVHSLQFISQKAGPTSWLQTPIAIEFEAMETMRSILSAIHSWKYDCDYTHAQVISGFTKV